MTSPIQQEIIDGLFYWDLIGQDWHRLLHRKSQDVVGHYRPNHFPTDRWVAVRHAPGYQSNGKRSHRIVNTADEARLLIETNAKEYWL
jgi:hypothetical protein